MGHLKASPMDKQRGSGSTFSTSGKRWWPFAYGKRNRKVAARNAKLRRMMKAGTLQSMTKDEMRKLIADVSNAR